MKKLFFCLFGLAAFAMSASAQNHSSLGVRAGINVANLRVSGDGSSFDSRVSFHTGVAYQKPVLRVLPLYLETGLYLSGRGARNIMVTDEGQGKANMLYLQVPLLVSWHFNIKNVSLQPYAGAYYALGIHGKLKANGEKLNLFKETTVEGENFPQSFKRSDVGLRFGLGVTIHKCLYVGAGYDLGLTDIIKDNNEIDRSKLKNGAFFLSLGFNFW